MWNKDSEKNRSNSGTKFVPFKLYLVHRRSLEKIRPTFDTITVCVLKKNLNRKRNIQIEKDILEPKKK